MFTESDKKSGYDFLNELQQIFRWIKGGSVSNENYSLYFYMEELIIRVIILKKGCSCWSMTICPHI